MVIQGGDAMAQKEALILLTEWKQHLRVSRATHYETAKQLSKTNIAIGISAIVSSAIVGTSILATVQETVNTNLKIVAGLVSVLAAVLGGIQTFLRLEERAENHRASGAKYSALIREIDEVLAYSQKGRAISVDRVKNIREQYDKVTLEASPTSQKVYEKALGIIKAYDAKRVTSNKTKSEN
jgi:hypothetical protein